MEKIDSIKISEEEKIDLNLPITQLEIENAIKQFKNSKSPGSDGLPIEFYKFFWPQIKNILFEAITFSLQNQELTEEQKLGIISLI